MQLNVLNLYDGVGTAALSGTYFAPDSTKAVIKAMTACNSTGAVIILTVKLVPRSGGTARTVIHAHNVASGETYPCPEMVNQVVEPGGDIQVMGLGIELVISGVQIVQ